MRKSIAAVLLAPFLLAQLAFVKAYEPGYVVPRGSDGDDTPGGHDLDASGAVIISMNIANPSSFISNRTLTRQVSGCQTVNSAAACGGSSDIVLVKTNRAGESLWNTSFGTAGADISHSVASGAEGYYVTGAADGQAFLAKVAKSDGRMDVFQVISAAGTIPTDVKVHPQNGDVFVAGYTTAGIDGCFAQGTPTSEAFLCRYNPTTLTRTYCIPLGSSAGSTTTMQPGGSIAFDYHGHVYWAGTTTGSVNASTPNLGGTDAWVAKHDINGNLVFAFNHGTAEDDGATAVAVDYYNDWLFILGTTFGSMSTEGVANHGARDVFLSRTQDLSSPRMNWTNLYGGPGNDYVVDLTQYNERIFLAGYVEPQGNSPWRNDSTHIFYNSDTWGGNDMIMCELIHTDNSIDSYPFVSTGKLAWCSLFGSSGNDTGYTVRVDSQYNMTVDGIAGGEWGTNTGVLLPFAGGASDAILFQYAEYAPPGWGNKTALDTASALGPEISCAGGSLVTPTATVAPTVAPTATATGTAALTTSTSRPSGAQGQVVGIVGMALALVAAVFAGL